MNGKNVMTQKKNNVVRLIDFRAAIINSLKEIKYRSNPEDVDYIESIICKNSIIKLADKFANKYCEEDFSRLAEMGVLCYIHYIHPLIVLPYFVYTHDLLDDDFLHLVCLRLKTKKLNAERKQIQQMAWKADLLYRSRENVESMVHAANIVVKIFSNGFWHEPEDCPLDFCDELPFFEKKE